MSAGDERQLESQQLQELRNQAAFGMDVEQFMNSPIGRYLRARANAEIEQAQDDFMTADVTDISKVTAIQNRILVAGKVLSWLGEAVAEGRNAAGQFETASD